MTTTELAYEIVTKPDGSPIEANTPEWLIGRQGQLGASEGPSILQLSPWDSPRDVYLRKVATTITDEMNEAMEFGHLMEPIARTLFERRHGDPDNTRHKYLGQIEPAPGLIRSKLYPWLGASLDAIIHEPDGQRAPGQIKNVTVYKRGHWDGSEGGVPDDVRAQVIQETIVLGESDHGWVLPIFGGNTMPEPIRVNADPDYVAWYLETSGAWWREHVVAGVEPAPTVLDDLSEIWAGVMGESVTLPPELIERVKMHKTLGAQIKALTAERDAVKLDVVSFMGDATEAIDATGEKPRLAATWRPHANPAKRFDKDMLLADHPELADLFAEYTFEGKTPRPFLSK